MEDRHETYKLPVLKIIAEAFALFSSNIFTLLKFAMPLIIVGVIYITYFYRLIIPGQQTSIGGILLLFPLFLVLMATTVMAVVGCHRTYLMSAEKVAATKIFRWSGRETRFLGWWFLIGLTFLLFALPLMLLIMPFMKNIMESSIGTGYLASIFLATIYVPIYYVVSRSLLVLPATAIDERNKSFNWSWYLSSGNGWRITFLVSGVPFLMNILVSFIPAVTPLLNTIIAVVLWLSIGAIGVALLSLSYAHLSKNFSLEEFENKIASEIENKSLSEIGFERSGPELQD